MAISECGASKYGTVEVVSLQIIAADNVCKLSVLAGNFNPLLPCVRPGSGEVILDPNSPISLPYTITLSGSNPCGTVSGTITLS
jgi:hypothetical protein